MGSCLLEASTSNSKTLLRACWIEISVLCSCVRSLSDSSICAANWIWYWSFRDLYWRMTASLSKFSFAIDSVNVSTCKRRCCSVSVEEFWRLNKSLHFVLYKLLSSLYFADKSLKSMFSLAIVKLSVLELAISALILCSVSEEKEDIEDLRVWLWLGGLS